MFQKHCHDLPRLRAIKKPVGSRPVIDIKLATVCENNCCCASVINRDNTLECCPGTWILSIVNIKTVAA